MDFQPRVTRARTRAVCPEDNSAQPHHSTSLCQSILGPPLEQVQPFAPPTWVPRPSGEADLQARTTLRSSRSATVVSWDANSVAPVSPPSPTYTEICGLATLTSPMAQDNPESEEEWFGVAIPHPYELNGASATSGKEGTVPSRHSHFSYFHSSPGAEEYLHHRNPPSGVGVSTPCFRPVSFRPSSLPPVLSLTHDLLFFVVCMRDFTEVRGFAPL
ncbi:hypothetical protein EV368DRAFT_89498 [Lentinula lateritia]|nr:hypothetical protein EV368DRAFT_89498 [Lentinula lateritia]